MLTLCILFVFFVGLALASLRWGFNSSDEVDSPEWGRRQQWYGFH